MRENGKEKRDEQSTVAQRHFNGMIRLFIIHAKIIHGNLSLVCTLFNIKL